MQDMRAPRLLLAATLAATFAVLAASAGAQVLRCEDAAGKVTYTDGTCPAGTKPQRVSTQEPVSVLPDPQGDSARAAREARQHYSEPPAQHSTAPAGAVIIDGRGSAPSEQRWDSDLGGDPQVAADGYYPYAYPYGAGVARPPARQRDMRPRIRNCDATGCTDRQGNTYNQNTGKLDRYTNIDGKTCRPVGTTVVCR
ncbi:MAG: DUF4124 domain-containing protein [Proteobacteria bacterium]|nr:DUF4124 domain-containing protein [Pseudomonadota bacterium]